MTSFLIASQILVFLHIAMGELAGASLLWTLKELFYFSADRLKWVRRTVWVAFCGSLGAWIAGGSYYLFFYPLVKPVIKDGPEDWGHLIFTESKEHIFLFIPVLLWVAAVFAQRKGHLLLEDKTLKQRYSLFVALIAILIFSMAFMGYMITWGARTALWVKAGL